MKKYRKNDFIYGTIHMEKISQLISEIEIKKTSGNKN